MSSTGGPSVTARRTFANGRVSLSVFGFGAAPIGNLYEEVAEADAEAALNEAFERGICYFDTAPFYGFGLSECRLGRAFAGRPRATFSVSTKVGRLIEETAQTAKPGLNESFAVSGRRAIFDYSRDGVRRSFEASVRRLGIDRIDILLLHDVGRQTHGDRHPEVMKQALDEALPAMAELRDAGVVNAIGIGVNEQSVCLELLPRFQLDCLMLAGRYTLLEQRHSLEVMAEAARRGVKVIVAAPYNSGLLADSRGPGTTYDYHQADAAVVERARKIYAECAAEGIDVGAAALQLPLAHPAVVAVVAGQRNATEVRVSVERMCTPLPPTLWSRLRSTHLIEPGTPVPVA